MNLYVGQKFVILHQRDKARYEQALAEYEAWLANKESRTADASESVTSVAVDDDDDDDDNDADDDDDDDGSAL